MHAPPVGEADMRKSRGEKPKSWASRLLLWHGVQKLVLHALPCTATSPLQILLAARTGQLVSIPSFTCATYEYYPN
jgi:hypothetical protein